MTDGKPARRAAPTVALAVAVVLEHVPIKSTHIPLHVMAGLVPVIVRLQARQVKEVQVLFRHAHTGL